MPAGTPTDIRAMTTHASPAIGAHRISSPTRQSQLSGTAPAPQSAAAEFHRTLERMRHAHGPTDPDDLNGDGKIDQDEQRIMTIKFVREMLQHALAQAGLAHGPGHAAGSGGPPQAKIAQAIKKVTDLLEKAHEAYALLTNATREAGVNVPADASASAAPDTVDQHKRIAEYELDAVSIATDVLQPHATSSSDALKHLLFAR